MRLLIPALAMGLVISGAIAAFLALRGGDESEAETRSFAVCDVVVEIPTDSDIQVSGWGKNVLASQLQSYPERVDLPAQARERLAAEWADDMSPLLAIQKGSDFDGPGIYLDPETGERIVGFGNASERAGLEAIAASVRVLDPSEKGWPYRQDGPVIRSRASNAEGVPIHWREPDPMSGLGVGRMLADSGPDGGGGGTSITLTSCQSRRTLLLRYDGTPARITEDNVAPEDREAFDRFFAEVEVLPVPGITVAP